MSDMKEFLCVENDNNSEEVSVSDNKRDFLIQIINQGKANKLSGKTPWTMKRLQNASDNDVEKLYHEYHQADAKHKAETMGKALSSHVVNLYSKGVSRVLRIDDVEQLRKDINSDPIIKESMADIGALLVGTFGGWLWPILITAHTANHTKGFVQSDTLVGDNSINKDD